MLTKYKAMQTEYTNSEELHEHGVSQLAQNL